MDIQIFLFLLFYEIFQVQDMELILIFFSFSFFEIELTQLVKNLPAMQLPGFDPWVGKIPWRRERLPTPIFWPGEFHGVYSSRGHKE